MTIKELKELALKATPGPYHISHISEFEDDKDFDQKEWAIQQAILFFFTPLTVFGNKSAIDYLKENRDGETYVKACIARMYGFHAQDLSQSQALAQQAKRIEMLRIALKDAAYNCEPCISCNRMMHAQEALDADKLLEEMEK